MLFNRSVIKIIVPALIVLTGAIVFAQKSSFAFFKKTDDPLSDTITNATGDDPVHQVESGDDPYIELNRIFRNYKNAGSLNYAGTIKMFNEDGDHLIDVVPFSCQTNGNNYHYMMDSVEMIYNRDIALNIFHRDKLISIARQRMNLPTWWEYSRIDSLKKYTQSQQSVIKVYKAGNLKSISVENTGDPDVYQYDIMYDPRSYKMVKIIMLMTTLEDLNNEGDNALEMNNENQDNSIPETDQVESIKDTAEGAPLYFNLYKLEINFNQLDIGPALKSFAPEQEFIQIKKGKVKVNETYHDYRIIVPGLK